MPDRKDALVSLRLDRRLLRLLDRLAEADHRTRPDYLRRILAAHVQQALKPAASAR